jgi:hypothetical protein
MTQPVHTGTSHLRFPALSEPITTRPTLTDFAQRPYGSYVTRKNLGT